MPQPGVCARPVSGCVLSFWPAGSSDKNRVFARTLRAALILTVVSVFGCFVQARELAATDEPSKSSSPSANENKTNTSSDSADKTDAKSDSERAGKKDGAAPVLEAAPAPSQEVSRRFPAAATEPGQLYLELRYNVDGTDIQGNQDRSFLHPGINHTAEISFFNNEPLGNSRRFEVLAVGRYTDNPQVDPQRNSLQRAYVRLQGPSFEVNLGDALVNFSRLSFNQNVKGLTLTKKLPSRLKLIGTVGFFVDRWGSLYTDYSAFRDLTAAPNPLAPGKPYSRFVAGTRLEQQIGRSNWIALNWSHGKDLQQSLPGATLACEDTITGVIAIRELSTGCLPGEIEVIGFRRPFPEAVNNDVLSGDTRVYIAPLRLDMRGEFAYSWTSGGTPPAGADPDNFACASISPVFGASVLDARCFTGQVGDWAGRFEAQERFKKLSWRVDYSRFEPDFFSANARQIRDLQDFSVRGEYEITRSISVVGMWRRSNDNLNGDRSFTNVVRAPEGRLVFRDLPFYRKMSLELGYRERNLDTPGTPDALDAQKRSTRIPFLSLIMPVRSGSFTFDYEHRHEINAITPALATDTDRFAIGYRAHYSWNRWEFSPTARFEIERLDKNTPLDAALPPTDLTLLFPNDFFSAFDTNRTIQAGFVLETPRYFLIEGSYKEFNGLALSPLEASATLNPSLPFLYFNQGFKRPSWRAAATYKIRNDENRTITVYYLRTNNLFPTGDPTVPDLRSFRETVIGGTVIFRFRK
jgi:hypothetical protein